ncbi:MAG TPA: hypothetical protein VK540_07130 [Polyangiaceae bacterium]|jgi:hypothetical protein|nr:hypothetical protein [Polyangiaceae bacterium]
MRRTARAVIGAVMNLLWVGGCAAIVGIDDHTTDASPKDSPQCIAYCDKVITACTGQFAVYSDRDACLGVCRQLPLGDEPFDNTVACRSRQADFAVSTQEPRDHCPAAGPGGDGLCGKNCEAWCLLLEKTCPKEFGAMSSCPRACAALKDTGSFSLDADHTGDTIQCRLEHVSNASARPAAPATHCRHAGHAPEEYCLAPQDKPPDCAEFCRFNGIGCMGDLAVYESNAQCMAVCMALDPGLNSNRTENTMGCRSWHTFNVLIDDASHCSHTGPGGDGHCGLDTTGKTGNCVSYCFLAEKACGAGFLAKYGTQSACQVECSTQPDAFGAKQDSKYRVTTATTGNTLQCRLLHVSRALSEATECLSALGQGDCQ